MKSILLSIAPPIRLIHAGLLRLKLHTLSHAAPFYGEYVIKINQLERPM